MQTGILSASYSESPVGKRRHYHDGHQLLYVAEGEAEITVGKETTCVAGGTLVLFSRFEEHSVEVKGSVYRRYFVRITPEFLNDPENELLFSLLVNRSVGFCRAISAKENATELERIFSRISKEFSLRESFRDEMLDALLRELLIVICRTVPEEMLPNKSEGAQLVYHLQKRMECDFSKPMTLSALADEYHVSVSHLSHMFKEVTGGSVMEYLFACRMLAAKKYLATTDMPIGQVVRICGFGDDSNFSRSFKQRTGMSPRQFRNAYYTEPVDQFSP